MNKKVLILSASPRKHGNSDLLCDRFADGARESGNEVEKIFLDEKNIGFCHGCGACAVTKRCVIKDDMAEILDKMVKADVIVMATPVYFYAMNGKLKTLIDRTVPRYTEISGKRFWLIMAAAEDNRENMRPVVEGFRGFLNCLESPKECGIIYGLGAWKIGEIKSSPSMQEAFEAGRSV